MSLLKSLLYALKEAEYNPVTIIHSTLYAATVTYLKVLKKLVDLNHKSFRNHVCETYHGKVVRLNDAVKFITINKNIELRNLDQVLPYRYAKDIILKNPQNIVAYECPCRAQKSDPCKPTDVCLVVGEPFADLSRMVQPFRSRRITPEEALRILKEEDQRGHVHTAWFKTAMLNRFYAICNCCKCCCLGLKFMFEYNMKTVLPSGYRAVVGEDCIGCGECVKYCQFDAIEIISISDNGKEKKKVKVIPERCFGCGICESKCKKENISLILDTEKGIPLNIEILAQSAQNVV
ncbi:MAG: 4Fe-4S dicluster domain-containing protein [Desulfobacterales bacterium]|nr:4Fe-4S dicluster domain-containing protein [Desulfobacterales bacterium]